MDNHPPAFIIKLLHRFCDPVLLEGILGDLEELYEMEYDRNPRQARLRFILRSAGFFRYAFLRKRVKLKINIEPMLRNYFNITIRSLQKHKTYAFINILGLVIGMASGFIILQHVAYELSYDQDYENKERIYRVKTSRYEQGVLNSEWASGSGGAGRLLKETFPEVEEFTILTESSDVLVENSRVFKPRYAFFASEKFFDIFSIPLLDGSNERPLSDPYTAVLGEHYARTLFGKENPVGKTLRLNDSQPVKVTGVFRDLPENSHMKFDVLYSFETYVKMSDNDPAANLDWDGFLNYIRVIPGTDPQQLAAKFPPVIADRIEEELVPGQQLRLRYSLQPLNKIHLTSDYRGEIKPTGDERATFFLLIIGLFVMLIAWINYVNLATAGALKRAKEVGIRKVLGSFRRQLINQFMFESFFVNLIAFVLAALLVVLVLPYFNNFLDRANFYALPVQPWFWAGLGMVLLTGTFFSGFYPALVLSSYKPLSTLKGAFSRSGKGNNLRRGLVVFQYLASIVLITGTYTVYNQLNYLRSKDLGVKIDQALVVEPPMSVRDSAVVRKRRTFRDEIVKLPAVSTTTFSSAVPGSSPGWNAGSIRLLSKEQGNQFRVIGCDENYIDFFGLEIIAGRDFDRTYGNETSNVLVNESALPLLGVTSAEAILKERMYFWGDTFNIVGVVKDYRHESPKKSLDGYIYRYREMWRDHFSVRINTNDMAAEVKKIENIWQANFGNQPFGFYFLDEHYNRQYRAEDRFGFVFGLFSVLAILVACLGLFGLSSYMTGIRLKEVSVRKVLGANFLNLWSLLTVDFLKLVLLAIIISLPLSWWLMNSWLQNFADRMTVSWLLFLVPALLLIGISVLTVSYHTVRTALVNPADNLKDE